MMLKRKQQFQRTFLVTGRALIHGVVTRAGSRSVSERKLRARLQPPPGNTGAQAGSLSCARKLMAVFINAAVRRYIRAMNLAFGCTKRAV